MKSSRRFVIVTDSHGEHIDREAEAMFRRFVKDYKPDIRIHAGDAFDFTWLRKKASDEEQRCDIHDDLTMGLDFLRWYKPTHITWGNHDKRVWDAAASDDGKMSFLAGQIIDMVESVIGGAKTYPYCKRNGVMQFGDRRIVHGYHGGINALSQAVQVYGAVIMGHVHRVEERSVGRWDGATGNAIGCLCNLDLKYNYGTPGTLAQRHGFAFGTIANGKVHLCQAVKLESGQWQVPMLYAPSRRK